jgi:hypothetical protein
MGLPNRLQVDPHRGSRPASLPNSRKILDASFPGPEYQTRLMPHPGEASHPELEKLAIHSPLRLAQWIVPLARGSENRTLEAQTRYGAIRLAEDLA